MSSQICAQAKTIPDPDFALKAYVFASGCAAQVAGQARRDEKFV